MKSMSYFLSHRRVKDVLASKTMLVLTVVSAVIILLMIAGLYFKSRPILANQTLVQLLFSSRWHPFRGEFGFLAFIMGTLWVTGVAVLIAVPAHRHLPFRICPFAGQGLGQAADRHPGRHTFGRVRGMGDTGDRAIDQGLCRAFFR
jgi:hypothetical protein